MSMAAITKKKKVIINTDPGIEYYERSHEEGEFRCVGRKRKGINLVHHARDAKHCGRPLAHRALAVVVCRVLGWDVKRLPNIVIDPGGTLGQALLVRL
ncbi:hypothetical protein D1007_09041 [Hordeum vulgare]|nr:hypothetical protein D1007_09041 [Hordeum vulgare]